MRKDIAVDPQYHHFTSEHSQIEHLRGSVDR
jgi:hypothetical protein